MVHMDSEQRSIISQMENRARLSNTRPPFGKLQRPAYPEKTYRQKFEHEFHYSLMAAQDRFERDCAAATKERAEYIKACYAVAEWLDKCRIDRPVPKPGRAVCLAAGFKAVMKDARKSAPTKKMRRERGVDSEWHDMMFEPVRLIFDDGFVSIQQYQFVEDEARQVRIKAYDSARVETPFTVTVNRKDLGDIVNLFAKDEGRVEFSQGVESEYLTIKGHGWKCRLKIVRDMPDTEVYHV